MVIGETVGANTTRYIHAPRGIHAMEDASGNWTYPMQDGLGSVRAEAGDNLWVQASSGYVPFGVPRDVQGTFATPFRFTGEQRDGTGVQYHRARYVNPALGTFLSLDPFEGAAERAMSLNGYGCDQVCLTCNPDSHWSSGRASAQIQPAISMPYVWAEF